MTRNAWGNGNLNYPSNPASANSYAPSGSGGLGGIAGDNMSWGGPISAHGMGNNSSFGLATLGHGTGDNNIGLPSNSYGRSNATGTIGEPFAASADGYEVNNADPYGSSSIYGDRAWRFSSSEVDMAPPFGYDLANIDQETKSKISESYMGNYTVNNNQASRGITS